MAAVSDTAMELDDIAVVNIGHPAISAEMPEDVPGHHAVIVLRLLGLSGQMLGLIAPGQVEQGRRLALFTPLAGGILTAVDPLPDLPCLCASGQGRFGNGALRR